MGRLIEHLTWLFSRRVKSADGLRNMNVVEDSPYYPFCWKESEDGMCSVTLYAEEGYKEEFLDKKCMLGTCDVWEQLARQFIMAEMPEAAGEIKFGSDEEAFCACSRNRDLLHRFMENLKTMCEDDKRLEEYICTLKEEEEKRDGIR